MVGSRSEPKMTARLDLGDRYSYLWLIDTGSGEVMEEVRLHALLQARPKPHSHTFFSVVPTACARTGSRRPGRRS